MIEDYYIVYEKWLKALHDDPNSEIEFRVITVHKKIKEARLEDFASTVEQLQDALDFFELKEYLESFHALGLLYSDVMADISDRFKPSLNTYIGVGNGVMWITQDLITGKIINMQLKR